MANKIIQLMDGSDNLYPTQASIPIAENADLDDYTSPGQYYSASSARTATLSNCPHSGSGFPMTVITYGGLPVQTIHTGAYIYERRKNTTEWLQWYRYTEMTEASTTLSIPSAQSGATITINYLRRYGKTVEMGFAASGLTIAKAAWVTIATIPTGYRPPHAIDDFAVDNGNGLAIQCRITEGGNINVWVLSSAPAAGNVRFHYTYLL